MILQPARIGRMIDAHCHLDLYKEPLAVADEIEREGIHTIAVTNSPSVFSFTKKLAESREYLHPAIGLHPQLVRERHKEIDLLLSLIDETNFVGEIGLDYTTKDLSERKLQQMIFSRILEKCAERGNKTLTVHSRRAAKDVIDMIGPNFPGSVILHWFSGSERELETAINYGMYFSVNTEMITSKKGKILIKKMPKNKVLTETDGPFVLVNDGPARPIHTSIISEYLSQLWGCSLGQTQNMLLENFTGINKNK